MFLHDVEKNNWIERKKRPSGDPSKFVNENQQQRIIVTGKTARASAVIGLRTE